MHHNRLQQVSESLSASMPVELTHDTDTHMWVTGDSESLTIRSILADNNRHGAHFGHKQQPTGRGHAARSPGHVAADG